MLPGDDDDALAWLLAPASWERFLADAFRKTPLLVQGRARDHYAGLFGTAELEHLAYASPERVRAGLQLIAGPERLTPGSGPLLAELRAAFARGYTIQIDSVEQLAPTVAALGRRFSGVFDAEIHFNLYFSPPGGKVFPAHADHHDAVVLQLEGRKQWKVYDERPELVGASLRREAPPSPERLGAPALAPLLGPGDLLYLPMGRFHEAETTAEASLHLTMGVYPYNGGKLLLDVLGELAASDLAFLEPISAWPSGGIEARLDGLLRRLGAAIDVQRRTVAHRAARLSAMPVLPGERFSRQPPLEHAEQLVVKRPGFACVVREEGERAAIHFPGGGLAGPANIAPLLRFVAEATGPFRPRDLPGALPEDSKLVLARRLAEEGLLIVTGPRLDS